MLRRPISRQNSLKLPGRSGIVAAKIASRRSPSSARSATKRSRSKLTFAPETTATSVSPVDRRALHVALRPRDRQCGGRLDRRARVLEDVLHRGADLVGVDEHDLVDVAPGEAERLAADPADGDAVGELPDLGEAHPPPGAERALHGVRVDRLDADHARLGPKGLHVGGDAGDQAAAADGDEHGADRLVALTQDLHADRALAGDHVRVVVGMDEGQMPPP